ncbi:nuclear transport factor 2 family protein [Shimia ponticola]|uniref:nuclear transport factor 2 family protein n=1 Tax=Shimia ponticola TaxID=2582893 RepID=UPI0011BE29F9|nr:nuclear transport factor 2 family protein [Shimia ponticola]
MTSPIDTFFSAWSETDAGRRTALIQEAIAETFVYSDPRSGGRLTGIDTISEYVGNFSANAPGWTATVESADEVNGYTRAIIAFGGMGPDGTQMTQHGTYFAEINTEDRLTLLAGFVGTGA